MLCQMKQRAGSEMSDGSLVQHGRLCLISRLMTTGFPSYKLRVETLTLVYFTINYIQSFAGVEIC